MRALLIRQHRLPAGVAQHVVGGLTRGHLSGRSARVAGPGGHAETLVPAACAEGAVLLGLGALLLGWFLFVGLIVWFVKTNGALNSYWRSLGAR